MDLIGKSRGFNFWCRIIGVIFLPPLAFSDAMQMSDVSLPIFNVMFLGF